MRINEIFNESDGQTAKEIEGPEREERTRGRGAKRGYKEKIFRTSVRRSHTHASASRVDGYLAVKAPGYSLDLTNN